MSETRSKKVLVAGGAGYIGSKLVPALVDEGHDVTVVDLLWFGNHLPKDVTVMEKDILSLTKEDLKGYDVVIFLAGLSNDPMAEFSPALNFLSNGGYPTYLAYTAKQAGVPKYIYGSSCSVYGHTDSDQVNETTVVNTQFPYGVSKLQGEVGVNQLVDKSFSAISFRQGTLSGFSPRMRFDLFINTMYMKAATEGVITVNNPAIWRPILAIEDAAKAYLVAVNDSHTDGVFNLASVNKTVGEVAKEIQEHFKTVHNKDVEIDEKDIFDLRNYRVSAAKAINQLGLSFEGTVGSILSDLDKNIGVDYDFDQDENYNIRVFEKLPKSISL